MTQIEIRNAPRQLTAREREVFAYIKHYIEKNNAEPLMKEVAAEVGICVSYAHKAMVSLHAKGAIVKKTTYTFSEL